MMMRKNLLYILALMFLGSCELEISENQASTFIKFYGNYLLDGGKDVVSTGQGGYAIAGTSAIPDSVSVMSLYLTDHFGNLLGGFPKYYSNGKNCGANSILKLDNGYLLCGYVLEPAGAGEFQEDIFIVRTNELGRLLWSKSYGGDENENAYHAIRGNTGGFVIAGYKEFNEEKDYWIFSIDEDGEMIREVPSQPIPDTDDDMAEFLINLPGLGYLCVCTYDEDTYDGTNVFILSLNNDLDSPYNLSLGTDFDDFGKCIIKESETSYYVLGNTENESSGKTEIKIYRIEMNGLRFTDDRVIATIRSVNEDLTGERLIKSRDGRLAVIGSSYANEDYNMFLQFLDPQSETLLESVYIGEGGTQTGSNIMRAEDDGLIIVGTNAFEGNSMVSLVKTDHNGKL
jgi:hypothetical protein